MLWFIFGIFFSIFGAATIMINQHFKADGYAVGAWRGFGISLLSLPFLFFIDLPDDPFFWLQAAIQGIMAGFFSSRLYNSSARFGAGATSRIMVLTILLSAIIWWITHISQFLALTQKPAIFIGILISMAMGIVGYLKMSDHSRAEGLLKYMLPAVFVSAMMSINRKELMAIDGFLIGNTMYFLVSMFVAGLFNVSLFLIFNRGGFKNFKQIAFARNTIYAGLLVALLSALTIFCGNHALSTVPNPAYVCALTLLSPLWVLLYNRYTGYQNNFNISGMVIMLIATACLIFFSDAEFMSNTSTTLEDIFK